jgi:hypothetical protein
MVLSQHIGLFILKEDIYFLGHILFYGYNLDVFCAVQALLSLNVEPSRIVVVHPNEEFKNVS